MKMDDLQSRLAAVESTSSDTYMHKLAFEREFDPPKWGKSHYNPIAGNLACSASFAIGAARNCVAFGDLEESEKFLHGAEESIAMLEKYIQLLYGYAPFRSAELTTEDGYFSGLELQRPTGSDAHNFYVTEAKRKLEEAVKSP